MNFRPKDLSWIISCLMVACLILLSDSFADDVYFKNGYVLKNVQVIKYASDSLFVRTNQGESHYPAQNVLRIESHPFDPAKETQMLLADKRTAEEKDAPQIGFFHLGFGGSIDFNNSGDIEKVMDPYKMSSLNINKYLNIIAGYRNIAQIEYRNTNIKDINLNYTTGNILEGREVYTIEMYLRTTQWLIKVNPFFFSFAPYLAIYASYGQGTASYLDDNKDGFDQGTINIFGLEGYYLAKYYSVGIYLEYHKIQFKKFIIHSLGYLNKTFTMSRFLLGATVNIGLGK